MQCKRQHKFQGELIQVSPDVLELLIHKPHCASSPNKDPYVVLQKDAAHEWVQLAAHVKTHGTRMVMETHF